VLELGGMGAPTFQVLDPEGKSVAILWGPSSPQHCC